MDDGIKNGWIASNRQRNRGMHRFRLWQSDGVACVAVTCKKVFAFHSLKLLIPKRELTQILDIVTLAKEVES